MKRPTIALAMICKNELEHFPRLLESVEGCFDEIHITDTGSTDGTLEYLKDLESKGSAYGAKIVLKEFGWIDDFSAARNFSYKDVSTDYVMWLDLDDVLSDREAFIKWRDTAMGLCDYWFATYNYAYEGAIPVLAHLRERVIRTARKPKWEFFIHEGILPQGGWSVNNTFAWTVNHMRTIQDILADRGRNLAIIEKHIKSGEIIPARLMYYYGKELADMGDFMNSWRVLKEVVERKDLEHGDRLMALEILSQAANECNNETSFKDAIHYALEGIKLNPIRAELWCLCGDVMFKQMRYKEAYAFYNTARKMPNPTKASGKHHDFGYTIEKCYGLHPVKMLSKCLHNLGEFAIARAEIEAALKDWPKDLELNQMLDVELDAIAKTSRDKDKLVQTDDFVITTNPYGAYPWDDEVYKAKGVGGSETAAIEMAHWMRKLTGSRVIVFNDRESVHIAKDGVEYRPMKTSNDYFNKFLPKTHIAWRHNMWMTDAKTYLWCHDLYTPGVEAEQNFDQMLCLSEFHKNYVQSMQGLPDSLIHLTRNGIVPSRFKIQAVAKNPNKVVFPSSPDRGLERAIMIVEQARKECPDLELHVYYGFDNLRKYGQVALADLLERMIQERPWVKYHGNVQQDILARELCEAAIWLYPANFIESYCITANECIAARCFPIVRDIGALPCTLKEAKELGQADIIDRDAVKPEDILAWKDVLVARVKEKAWEKIDIDFEKYSWESVAREWCEFMGHEIVDEAHLVNTPILPKSLKRVGA